ARAYVTNLDSDNVSVINTTDNTVLTTIPVGTGPRGVAISPDGARAYVTNQGSNNVSVINTTDNTVLTTIPVGTQPLGVAVSPAGGRAYVTNVDSNNVSVINTTDNTVLTTIPVGTQPVGVTVGAVPGQATVDCPSGSVLTGGGFKLTGPAPDDLTSQPVDDTWLVSGQNETQKPLTLTPYALCADNTP
ncbi:YncE family protein, partial [Streptomyces sp. NPDC127084]|uniref:YncE family protein n=1 Tax=Streptomyces sp. NPDC127084 TaxID=3347133 RepID=UPI0036612CBE